MGSTGSTAGAGTTYLTTAELAARLRVPESTVRYWRTKGYGPRSLKVGRHLRFSLAEVQRFEAELEVESRAKSA